MNSKTQQKTSITSLFSSASMAGIVKTMAAAAAAVALLAAPRASAANGADTWVGNGSINFADANWTGANNPPISGDSWVFGAAGISGTTLNNNLSGFSVAGITFNSGASAFTFTNDSITLTGGLTNLGAALETINFPIAGTAVETVNTTGGGSITLGGNVSGTGGGYSLIGSGTLTFSGTNTFTGALTVASNTTLTIGGAGYLGGATAHIYAGAIANAGTFNYNSSGSETNSAVISGAGTLNVNGPGTLTLSTSPNTISGATTINGGILQITSSSGGNGNLESSAITINSGGEMDLNANDCLGYSVSLPITISGTLKKINNQSETLFRPITLNGGTMTTTSNGVEQFETYGNYIQTVAGTANYVNGPGMFGLRTASCYISNQANSSLTFSCVVEQNANASGTPLNIYGAGTTYLTATNTFTGNIVISNGTLVVGGAGLLGSGNYGANISNYATFNYNSSAGQIVSGIIAGTGALIQSGPGTLMLSGANTYTGTTTVNGGELVVSATQPNTSPVIVNDGGTLGVAAAGSASFSPTSLTLGSSAGATVRLGLSSTTQAPLTPVSLIRVGSNTVILSGSFAAGNSYPVLSSTLSGTGTLNFVIPNGVGGSVSSSVTAGVTTYTLNVTSVTPTIWTSAVNGTWDINTTPNWSFNSVAGKYIDGSPVQFDDADNTGGIYLITNVSGTLSPSTIFVNNSAKNYVFSNNIVIAGGGGITKSGTANLTNCTVNTYTGPTVINAGSLVAGVAAAGGPGAFGLNSAVSLANVSGATLNLNGFSTQIGSLAGGGATGGNVTLGSGSLTLGGDSTSQTYSGVISGTGGLTKIGSGNLTLAGVNTFSGAIGGITGTLTIGGAGQLNSGAYAGAIADNGLIVYNSTANQALSGVISGTGGLTMSGGSSSTLTLGTAVETFTGPTIVNSGTLILTGPNATASGLSSSSSITINNGGTIQVNSDNAFQGQVPPSTAGPVTINNGGTLTVLASADSNTGASSHIPGVLYLNGGTLAAPVTQANPWANWGLYNGVVVNGGVNESAISAYSVALAVPGGVPFNVYNGGTASGVDLLVSGGINHTSDPDDGLIKQGNGTMELTGANTMTSAITISAGTLILGGTGSLAGGTYNGLITDNGVFIDSSTTAQTFENIISGTGALEVNGSGVALTLSGANTYSGPTVVNAGTLYLSGSGSSSIGDSSSITITNGGIFDVSQLSGGSYTMGASQNLIASNSTGANAVNGSVVTGSSSKIYPGGNGTVGTLTFNGALTLSSGTAVSFDLSTLSTADNGNNDKIIANGALSIASGNSVTLNAVSGAANLDTNSDYLLMSAASLTGGFNAAPIWTGTKPNNFSHFIVTNDTVNNQVRLTYTAAANPTITAATATPATGVLRNQPVSFSVTATKGTASITNVALGLSSLNLGTVQLALSSTTNVWTNTVTIPASAAAGTYPSLPVTATDANGNQGGGSISLAIVTSTETWSGGTLGNENFDNNPNWAKETGEPASYAPGYVGDSLVFAGNGGNAGPNPNMDNPYTVAGLSFSSGASSFDITPDLNGDPLTLSGGAVVNNSANPQTLNVPIILTAAQAFDATAGNLILGGAIADSGNGLTVSGPYSVSLAGDNTYTGPSTVNSGTLNITSTGTVANSSAMTVGGAAGDAVLDVSGTLSQPNVFVGNVSGSVGAVYQTGGSVTITGGAGGDLLDLGNVSGSFGYYDVSGGTLTADGIAVGGENNYITGPTGSSWGNAGGNGILEVNAAGTVTDTGWLVMARSQSTTAETGILNVYGGTLTFAVGGLVCNWGANQTSIINVMGGTLSTSDDLYINMNENGSAANTGILNLDGGVFQVGWMHGGANNTYVNFNGGTLQANEAQAYMMAGMSSATIYSGGATIDSHGSIITVGQALLPPTGNGVYGIGSLSGGAGYIAPPIVLISGGGGTGATAIAQIDTNSASETFSEVTNVIVTCPGVNYTAPPTFTLSGGGFTTAATVTGTAPTPNTSGGLAIIDSVGGGSTTLTGASTYTGATTISGDLLLSGSGSINNSAIINVQSGGVFDVTALTSYTTAAGQILEGAGTVNVPTATTYVTIGSGSAIQPGLNGTFGLLTINGGLTLASGSTANFNLSTTYNGNNGQVGCGTLTLGATSSLQITATGGSAPLDTNSDYVLFSASSVVGAFGSLVWEGVKPSNYQDFSVQYNANNQVVLHYSLLSPPTGTGSATPSNNVVRNSSVFVSVTVTPGTTRTIGSVTMDTTLIGGSPGQQLFEVNSSYVWTNTFLVGPATAVGPVGLTATITDTASPVPQVGYANIALLVVPTVETWNGNDRNTDQYWNDNGNWASGLAPGYVGDSLIFAGPYGLAPDLYQNNYTVNALTFTNGAGPFVITSSGSTTLTLAADSGVTNDSTSVETFTVGMALGGAVTFNAGSGGLMLGPVGEVIAGTGVLTTVGTGTTTLPDNNTYTGSTIIGSNTVLAVGVEGQSTGQLNSGAYAANITDNGTLSYNSGAAQAITGVISGTGGLTMNGGSGSTLTLGTAVSTFTGPTVVNSGTLILTGPNATASGLRASSSITINNGGTIEAGGDNAFQGQPSTAGPVTINVGGVLTGLDSADGGAGPSCHIPGLLTLNGGTLASGGTGNQPAWGSWNFFGGVAVPGTSTNTSTMSAVDMIPCQSGGTLFNVTNGVIGGVDLNVTGTLIDGTSQADTGIIKNGNGTMAMLGQNTYTGTTIINGGIINLGSAETPGTSGPLGNSAAANPGSIVFGGGTLQYSSTNQANDYSGRFSTAAGQPISIDTAGQSITFATALTSSGGSLTITDSVGSGVLTLTAAETYSGNTTINGGTLALGAGGSLASTSDIIINAGNFDGTFNVTSVTPYTLGASASLTASGTAIPANIAGVAISLGSRPIILNYDGSHPALTISSGTLSLNGNAFTVNGSVLPIGNYVVVRQASGTINSSGTYPAVVGTAIGTGYKGSISVNGAQVLLTISLGINTTPPTVVYTYNISSSILTLSWPSNLGWILQSNSISLADTNGWFNVAGSSNVTTEAITINKSGPAVFFRMAYPTLH
jgi:autotransporter-associated beta strand protein